MTRWGATGWHALRRRLFTSGTCGPAVTADHHVNKPPITGDKPIGRATAPNCLNADRVSRDACERCCLCRGAAPGDPSAAAPPSGNSGSGAGRWRNGGLLTSGKWRWQCGSPLLAFLPILHADCRMCIWTASEVMHHTSPSTALLRSGTPAPRAQLAALPCHSI